jgi:hypothetical protein
MLFREVNRSYAMRAASRSCRQVIDRVEWMAHVGTLNVEENDQIRQALFEKSTAPLF